MKRLLPIFAAVCAVLLLPGCNSREVLVTKAVNLGFRIGKVTGTKVYFSTHPDNQDATYIFFCHSEEHPLYNETDSYAARERIRYLEEVTDLIEQDEKSIGGSFADYFCYRGSRTLKITRLSSNTQYRILIFQINPKTHAIIGDVISEVFRTKEVPQKPMSFSFAGKANTIVISPSDMERTYFWSFDRISRIVDNYGTPYSFLYEVLDMYEAYGFADHVLSKGNVHYDVPPNQLWEGEEYCVCAIGYEDGEINSDEGEWYFVYRDGQFFPTNE